MKKKIFVIIILLFFFSSSNSLTYKDLTNKKLLCHKLLWGFDFISANKVKVIDTDLNKETRTIQNCNDNRDNAGACVAGPSDADTGDQIIDGKVNDLVSIYATMPVGEGAYVKAGYIQATLVTSENLATGSKYEDVDLTGLQVGAGYEGELGDNAFWRAEGSYQMWDDIDTSGSESNASDDTTKNRITAEIGSIMGSLSVGMKF